MSSLVVAVLNGWGASSRRRETRTAELVRKETDGAVGEDDFLASRAMLGMPRSRKYRRFILSHQDKRKNLLIVAKSLGSHNMIKGVLNHKKLLRPLDYRKIGFLSIDPCWPLWHDMRPNLNRHLIHLKRKMDRTVNFLAIRPPDEQAGAIVRGPDVINIPLTDVTHTSIVMAEEVRSGLFNMINFLLT